MFAAFELGAIPVNVNYRYTRDELAELLADADARALVFSTELAANIMNLPPMRLVVGTDALEELLAATSPRPPEPRPGTDQLFMYTGGTTGKPKGMIWQLSDLLNSLLVPIFRSLGVPELPATLGGAVRIGERSGDLAPRTMPVVPGDARARAVRPLVDELRQAESLGGASRTLAGQKILRQIISAQNSPEPRRKTRNHPHQNSPRNPVPAFDSAERSFPDWGRWATAIARRALAGHLPESAVL